MTNQKASSERYYVSDDGKSNHLWFEYTVVDSMEDSPTCECVELEHAEHICSLLNKECKNDN